MNETERPYPSRPEDFEPSAYIPTSERIPRPDLVCIEDAECNVMCYAPTVSAAAIVELLNLGMTARETIAALRAELADANENAERD